MLKINRAKRSDVPSCFLGNSKREL